jgi:hypothetical protein
VALRAPAAGRSGRRVLTLRQVAFQGEGFGGMRCVEAASSRL